MGRNAVVGLLCVSMAAMQLFAGDGARTAAEGGKPSVSVSSDVPTISVKEINELRERIAEQETQIERLQKAVSAQQKAVSAQREMLETAVRTMASRTAQNAAAAPMLVNASGVVTPAPAAQAAQDAASIDVPAPLSLKIGNTFVTPIGFLDLTYVNRSTNVGSGLGTSYGAIPFNNQGTAAGNLNDSLFSVQNSRIGARFDSIFHDTKVLGYWESDFLGIQPPNIMVTSNPATFRLRLFFTLICRRGSGKFWAGRRGL